MTFTTITYERLDGVARITLNRPARANALNQAMLAELCAALDEIGRRSGGRAR